MLLVNASDPDSSALATHYERQRSEAETLRVAVPMPLRETISWADYVRDIHNPLQRALIEHGWLDAAASELADAEGRMRTVSFGHSIDYLAVLRGVPLRIAHDPKRIRVPDTGASERARTTQGSVDGELALLAVASPPLVGFVANPWYRGDVRGGGGVGRPDVVRVSRIDGPTLEDCLALVDHGIEAERMGLAGRAYVDSGGPHRLGDAWMDRMVERLARAWFDVETHPQRGIMMHPMRFDAPVLYFGWYAEHLAGPMALEGFRFEPGAIAVHVHSFSARTLRSDTEGWCGPLIARGATATLGNVYEPYLELSHDLDRFLEVLLEGRTFGEAACEALPALGWQAVAIGDPLYRPFALDADEGIELRRASGASIPASLLVRESRRRLAAGEPVKDALAEAQSVGEAVRDPRTLAWAAYEAYSKSGDEGAALRQLDGFERLDTTPGTEVLSSLVAGAWIRGGRAERAVKVLEAALNDAATARVPGLSERLLGEAVTAARAAGATDAAERWSVQLSVLRAVESGGP
ncbi:hypothetical protein ASA1KI_39430 [Opitutales bacterium ASA1]|uniref:TIGR03790 family protein n=1 Tax=Congregicoccus parvus TaxID=3081749 RepID=UPI002B2CE8F7|nr:hypothetical protein ASA1KI_39430 [Opitutales bacterium ASA1]